MHLSYPPLDFGIWILDCGFFSDPKSEIKIQKCVDPRSAIQNLKYEIASPIDLFPDI